MVKLDNRLEFRYILSQVTESDDKWNGEVGRMNAEIANSLANTTSTSHSTFCFGCGPAPFTDLCQTELAAVGFKDEFLHFFRG